MSVPATPQPGVHAVVALRRAFESGVRMAGVPPTTGPQQPVTAEDVAELPPSVQRYLHFMGVIGRPTDRSFRARSVGRFRLRPQQRWMPMEMWQHNSGPEPVRLSLMRIRFGGVLPMVGWDTYAGGHGRMHGKLLGLITVADGKGQEFDTSELVTWLNDAIMLAPSMLLGPQTSWSETTSNNEFDVTLTPAGGTVSARVYLDDGGAPRDFSTEDRWADLPDGLVRARWTTPIKGWKEVAGHRVPTGGAAIWHLPDGEFRYAELQRIDRMG